MEKKIQQIKARLKQEKPVYSASFIFRLKQYDTEFEHLNKKIDQLANATPGYLGKEGWANEQENKKSVIYYWDSLQALKTFSNHPDHQKAKQHYNQWYSGYEIIVAEVLDLKSDGGL